jgi:hypothetical protein
MLRVRVSPSSPERCSREAVGVQVCVAAAMKEDAWNRSSRGTSSRRKRRQAAFLGRVWQSTLHPFKTSAVIWESQRSRFSGQFRKHLLRPLTCLPSIPPQETTSTADNCPKVQKRHRVVDRQTGVDVYFDSVGPMVLGYPLMKTPVSDTLPNILLQHSSIGRAPKHPRRYLPVKGRLDEGYRI